MRDDKGADQRMPLPLLTLLCVARSSSADVVIITSS
jgi:hypothetical protein